MQIDLHNPNQLLSHFLLDNAAVRSSVAESSEWRDNGKLTATVFINGFEIPAESFEETLKQLIQQVEDYVREKYNATSIDDLVENRAKALLKEHANNALEKIYDITSVLESAEDIIKPHWER